MMQNFRQLRHKFIVSAGFVLCGFFLMAQPYGTDSIVKAADSDKYDKTIEAVIDGRLPLGVFDLDMNRVLHLNLYQGLNLGLGLHTNDRLSKLFSLGGYWGYGFASKSATYGADGTLVIDRHSETNLKLGLSHDVSESGGLPDFGEVKR